MARRNRSQNPDLLFREVMDERVERTADYWGWRTGTLGIIDRITAFVTHRCNLRCTYCNGPHLTWKIGDATRKREMLRHDLSIERFRQLLKETRRHATVRHIHFTGGEATAHPELQSFVAAASAVGILTSITTNGTADPDVYRALIAAGLSEIRISIDSHDASMFDRIVSVRGSFDRVIRTIREIVRLRDENSENVFLILNACVGSINLDAIERTLTFLLALRPDDIKVLVIAEEKGFVLDRNDTELIRRLQALLTHELRDRYPLLREKLKRLFDPAATGLADEEAQAEMKHCFIPLSERTIDGQHYYPCSIVLRQYGAPLGELSDPYEVQQQKILDFVRCHDCRTDPICLANCTNCCKVFNVRTNLALVEDVAGTIDIATEVPAELIATTIACITELRRSSSADRRPFLIIKPNGLSRRDAIIRLIRCAGLIIASSEQIEHWADRALALYTWPLTNERVRHALQINRAFQMMEPGPAELLRFTADLPFEVLERLKLRIRECVPTKRYRLNLGDRIWWIRVTAAHTPDPGDIERENAILANLLRAAPQ